MPPNNFVRRHAIVVVSHLAVVAAPGLAHSEEAWTRPVLPYPSCPRNLAPAVKVEPAILEETPPGEVTVEYDVVCLCRRSPVTQ
jgi:hypothetical protein